MEQKIYVVVSGVEYEHSYCLVKAFQSLDSVRKFCGYGTIQPTYENDNEVYYKTNTQYLMICPVFFE